MPCYHPLDGWLNPHGGKPYLRQPHNNKDATYIPLPCGKCVGCRQRQARDWAIRCTFEQHHHSFTSWCTLTYRPESQPWTLNKDHYAAFIKRLRHYADDRMKHFGCGEYGEKKERPHYHAILFGFGKNPSDKHKLQDVWPHGYARLHEIRPEAIAYVAGYAAKKYDRVQIMEQTNPETGELWQPEFIQMSRRPGIGEKYREKYKDSWRNTAIYNGQEVPVPRYLGNAWKKQGHLGPAIPEWRQLELDTLRLENQARALLARDNIEAAEKIALAKQDRAGQKRRLA